MTADAANPLFMCHRPCTDWKCHAALKQWTPFHIGLSLPVCSTQWIDAASQCREISPDYRAVAIGGSGVRTNPPTCGKRSAIIGLFFWAGSHRKASSLKRTKGRRQQKTSHARRGMVMAYFFLLLFVFTSVWDFQPDDAQVQSPLIVTRQNQQAAPVRSKVCWT